MLFQTFGATAATPDPVANPGDVPEANILRIPESLPNTNAPPVHFLITAEDETAALTVDLYVEIEESPEEFLPQNQKPAAADRKWRFVETIVGAAGQAVYSLARPAPGNYVVRVTAGAGAGVVGRLGII